MESVETKEDLLVLEQEPVRASRSKRFTNYLIDLVLFYILLFIGGIVLALIAPDMLNDLPQDNPGFNLADRILSIFLYGLYMSIVEAVFKGKSLGKLITGTRAVYEDGSRISVKTAFARGFSRAVPLCAFSALGEPPAPWQDRWTNTLVIDEKLSRNA